MHVHRQFSNVLLNVTDDQCHSCGNHDEKLYNKLILVIDENIYFIQDKTDIVSTKLKDKTEKGWFNYWFTSPQIKTIDD